MLSNSTFRSLFQQSFVASMVAGSGGVLAKADFTQISYKAGSLVVISTISGRVNVRPSIASHLSLVTKSRQHP